jgi:cytochrome c oxidase assembly factor CtaG
MQQCIEPWVDGNRGLAPHMIAMRILALVVPLFVILAASVWWATALWISVEGPPMPASGHVAMWLGIIFSLVIGCGLMALMFFSSRRGYDDAASGRDIEPR